MPWHYTTIVDFVDHRRILLAGLIALIAAMLQHRRGAPGGPTT
jgi:hypothetical protein